MYWLVYRYWLVYKKWLCVQVITHVQVLTCVEVLACVQILTWCTGIDLYMYWLVQILTCVQVLTSVQVFTYVQVLTCAQVLDTQMLDTHLCTLIHSCTDAHLHSSTDLDPILFLKHMTQTTLDTCSCLQVFFSWSLSYVSALFFCVCFSRRERSFFLECHYLF